MARRYVALATLFAITCLAPIITAQNGADLYQQGRLKEDQGHLQEAINIFEGVVTKFETSDRTVAAKALGRLGALYELLGQDANAQKSYRRLINEFANEAPLDLARNAREKLTDTARPSTTSALFVADMDPAGLAVRGRVAKRLMKDMAATQDTEPAWSPDGKHISFVRSHLEMGPRGRGSIRSNVYVRPLAGADESLGADGSAFFYHDGQNVLFVSERQPGTFDLSNGLHVTSLRYADLKLPVGTPGIWTRAARQSCVISIDDKEGYCLTDPLLSGGQHVFVLDLVAWKLKRSFRLPAPYSSAGAVALSPDGKTLALVRGDRLARVSLESPSGNAADYEELVSGIGELRSIRWTKKGEGILFGNMASDTQWKILRTSSRSGSPIRFTGLEVTGLTSFDLNPDGSQLVFDGLAYKITSSSEYIPPSVPAPIITTTDGDGAPPLSAARFRLAVFDRNGKLLHTNSTLIPDTRPAISPDGSRIAAVVGGEVMLFEVGEDIPTRLTTGAAAFGSVAWSPDGKRIAYRSGNPLLPGLYVQAVDRSGKEELLFPVGIRRLTVFLGWTNNVVTFGGPEQRRYRALPIDPVGTPVEFPRLMGFEPRLSPDGRTFASINPQGGELFVRPFDLNAQVQSTKSWTVTGNAASYRWSADGKNLYFLDQNGAVISLPVATSPEFSITGSPEKLFQAPSGFSMPSLPPNDANHRFDVNADGQRFVFLLPN